MAKWQFAQPSATRLPSVSCWIIGILTHYFDYVSWRDERYGRELHLEVGLTPSSKAHSLVIRDVFEFDDYPDKVRFLMTAIKYLKGVK